MKLETAISFSFQIFPLTYTRWYYYWRRAWNYCWPNWKRLSSSFMQAITLTSYISNSKIPKAHRSTE